MARRQNRKLRFKLKLGTGVDWEALGPIPEPFPFCIDSGCTTLCLKHFLSLQILDGVFDPSSLRLRLEGSDRELEETVSVDGPTTSTYQPKLLRLDEQGVCNGSVVQLDVCAPEEEMQRYLEEAEARAVAKELAGLDVDAPAKAAAARERLETAAAAGAAGRKPAAGPPVGDAVQLRPAVRDGPRRAVPAVVDDSDEEQGCYWSDGDFGVYKAVSPDGLYAVGKGRKWLSLLAKDQASDDSEGELPAGARRPNHGGRSGGGRGGRGAGRGGPGRGQQGSGRGRGRTGAGRSSGAAVAAAARPDKQQARSGEGAHAAAGKRPRRPQKAKGVRLAMTSGAEDAGPPRKKQRVKHAIAVAGPAGNAEASPGRKEYDPWSLEEIVRLVKYIEKHGVKRWSDFLADDPMNRTVEQVKMKWRNLKYSSDRQWQGLRRVYVPVDLQHRIDLLIQKIKAESD